MCAMVRKKGWNVPRQHFSKGGGPLTQGAVVTLQTPGKFRPGSRRVDNDRANRRCSEPFRIMLEPSYSFTDDHAWRKYPMQCKFCKGWDDQRGCVQNCHDAMSKCRETLEISLFMAPITNSYTFTLSPQPCSPKVSIPYTGDDRRTCTLNLHPYRDAHVLLEIV